MEVFKKILKDNWKLILTVLVAVGGSFGVVSISKGERFEIHVVLPEDADAIFGEQVTRGAADDFSPSGRRALRLAGLRLHNGGDRGQLFGVLRAIHNDPMKLSEAERAANVSGLDPVTLSILAKVAIQIAIAILERTAPDTKTPLDDRLLSLLKLFSAKPEAIAAAHRRIVN